MAWFEVRRDPSINKTIGGHVYNEKLAFACEFECPGVQLVLNGESVWMSRDEAIEVAYAILLAARDG